MLSLKLERETKIWLPSIFGNLQIDAKDYQVVFAALTKEFTESLYEY